MSFEPSLLTKQPFFLNIGTVTDVLINIQMSTETGNTPQIVWATEAFWRTLIFWKKRPYIDIMHH